METFVVACLCVILGIITLTFLLLFIAFVFWLFSPAEEDC